MLTELDLKIAYTSLANLTVILVISQAHSCRLNTPDMVYCKVRAVTPNEVIAKHYIALRLRNLVEESLTLLD
jgi:hypothetical protein